MRALMFLSLLLLAACGGKGDEDAKQKKQKKWVTAAKCKVDKDCAKGFICKGDTEKTCQKGERTAAEMKAMRKAANEARRKALEAKNTPDPGEGRLHVRVCPFFKNTPESIGTLVATNQATKKKHMLHMALETPDLGFRDQFVYRSLPLGKYDVTATYGIQKGGKPNVSQLKCDEKAKLPCRDELIREIEVVLPADEPKPEMNDKGKPKKPPCDFIAE